MKILTQEEKDANYRETVKGGVIGGVLGLALGGGAVVAASKRWPAFRGITVPFRAFIAVSTGTFSSIIVADRFSNNFEIHRNKARLALQEHKTEYDRIEAQKPFLQRARDYGTEHRYSIVFAAWVASIGVSGLIVKRNPYLTTSQKLVQARMYAQAFTIATLLGSFGLEAKDAAQQKGRWETIKVLDPDDPLHKRLIEKRIHHERYEGEDQWMEVIAAEEERIKERKAQHEAERKTIMEAQQRAHPESGSNSKAKQNQ